jgi:hypothetical protein
MSQMTRSVCRNHYPVFQSLMTYQRVCNRVTQRLAIGKKILVGFVLFGLLLSMQCFVDHYLSFF